MIDINKALSVYLGTDERGGYLPVGKENRLQNHYGELVQQARDAIREYLQFDFRPDWSKQDLGTVSDSLTQELRAQFPELALNVARGLANRFTYNWR